jgi:ubiquitin-conjugating enzyme E2 J1
MLIYPSSRDWTCPHCRQTNLELLPDPPRDVPKEWEPGNTLKPDEHVNAAREVPATVETRESSKKPHLLLDTSICILLVLLFAIICRRVV